MIRKSGIDIQNPKRIVIRGEYVDLFIRIGQSEINKQHQLRKVFSTIYDCYEYVWRGNFVHGKKIQFTHLDERTLPDPEVYNQISGPGCTFSGAEACASLNYENALVCPVLDCDLIYNFIDHNSELRYIGKTGKHTLFVRVYDNNTGDNNDRWLVISME